MPSYIKNNWISGDKISADKLNHIEQGIYENTLPDIDEFDDNKVLAVVNGKWEKSTLPKDLFVITADKLITPSAGMITSNRVYVYPEYYYDWTNAGNVYIYNGDFNDILSRKFVAVELPSRYTVKEFSSAVGVGTSQAKPAPHEFLIEEELFLTNSVPVFYIYLYCNDIDITLLPLTANIELGSFSGREK